jgi:hypothetical protein
VRTFLKGVLEIAGITDEPVFTRSMIVNSQEEIQLVLQAAQYLDEGYITRKILTLLGDGDLADKMIAELDADELDRFSEIKDEGEQIPEDEAKVENTGSEAAQIEE